MGAALEDEELTRPLTDAYVDSQTGKILGELAEDEDILEEYTSLSHEPHSGDYDPSWDNIENSYFFE